MAEAVQWYEWLGVAILVIGITWLDLFRSGDGHEPTLKESAFWSFVYIALAILFGLYVYVAHGLALMMQYYAGYSLEKALSIDNLFVMETIFAYFALTGALRHRALAWGIIGAILMRTVLIFLGVELVERFTWLLPVFGVILGITAYKLAFGKEDHNEDLSQNWVFKLLARFIPMHDGFVGQNVFTRVDGRWNLTRLGMAILMVEATDLVFAVDSIPAVMGVTTNPFVILTSNIFAILGLRALYFLLSGVMGMFRFLKPALAFVLAFIGAKMLLMPWVHVPIGVSLGVVLGTIILAMLASVLFPGRKPAPAR